MNVEAKVDNHNPTMLSTEEKAMYGWDIVSFSERMTERLGKIRMFSAENDDTKVRTSGKENIRQ